MRQQRSKMFTYTVFKTPFGFMGAAKTLLGMHTVVLPRKSAKDVVKVIKGSIGQECFEDGSGFSSFQKRISAFFSGKPVCFHDAVDLDGASDFEKRVWSAAAEVPWGQFRSYGWIARSIGRPGAGRAVGKALSRNRLPILIPCHRVIRKDGGLGGFADGLQMKRALLRIEGSLQ
jgi:methylated-DNA-[protein]-cysteine S-methyltransferase